MIQNTHLSSEHKQRVHSIKANKELNNLLSLRKQVYCFIQLAYLQKHLPLQLKIKSAH